MNGYLIRGVFTGKPQWLSNGFESSITKKAVPVLHVHQHGIDGDVAANQKHHGGEMRVIHHYSQKNYDLLKKRFPDIADLFVPGSFGENILTDELSEEELNIGDLYALGSAKVQLTVSRRPCASINAAYDDNRVLKEVLQTGHTGWFYRVLEEGEVRVGDKLVFLGRPFPDLPVSRLYDQGYGTARFSDRAFLQRCLDTGLMDKGWKPKLAEALNT